MTRHRAVERSTAAATHQPALPATFGRVATVRIRNQATLGGNLAHADPSQDPPPTLIAMDAAVEIVGPAGRRTLPVEELFVDHLTTSLEAGELIVGVRIPAVPPGTAIATTKFLPRTADDYATVAVAVAVRRDEDGRIATIRIALGGVAPIPVRARAVEAALANSVPGPARIDDAAALVRGEVDPLGDARGSAGYKREMSRVWVARMLREAIG
jgi:carbon-monoxide dehydrogenase medium subunit